MHFNVILLLSLAISINIIYFVMPSNPASYGNLEVFATTDVQFESIPSNSTTETNDTLSSRNMLGIEDIVLNNQTVSTDDTISSNQTEAENALNNSTLTKDPANSDVPLAKGDNKVAVQQSYIKVLPNRYNYVIGQQVHFILFAYDSSSPEHIKVKLQVSKDGISIFDSSQLFDNNFKPKTMSGPSLLASGTYLINATMDGDKNKDSSITYIDVSNLFMSTPLYFFYLILAFFVGLVVVIILGLSNQILSEILRFVFITGIVMSAISVLIFTDISIGVNSPIGLIKDMNKEWFLNIGGQAQDTSEANDARDSISIPIYVLIFGLMGGYLRYLYKTAKLKNMRGSMTSILLFRWDKIPGEDSIRLKEYLNEDLGIDWINTEEFVKEGNTITISKDSNNVIFQKENDTITVKSNGLVVSKLIPQMEHGIINIYEPTEMRNWLFHHSLEDLSLLFLAPLLAISIWFFLVQGGMESNLTLALAAFTVGLVTDEIIKLLFNFIRRVIGGAESIANGNAPGNGASGTQTSGGASGTQTSGGASGTQTSGGASGTQTSGGASGTQTSGGASGTQTSGGASGTQTSGGASGTQTSGGASGTQTSGGASGTQTSGGASGTQTKTYIQNLN